MKDAIIVRKVTGPFSHERKAEPDEPTVYRLTEDNLHTISPMIGLTEKEIATFFDVKQPN